MYTYFPKDGRDGGLIVDNFHPIWQEGAKRIMSNPKMIEIIKNYSEDLRGRFRYFDLHLDNDFGVRHVNVGSRSALDLDVLSDIKRAKYVPHNLSSERLITPIFYFMNFYLNHLRDSIEDILKTKN